ncbi:MAG: glycosyltransferase [Planctomycetes bacterium]|nr:glycosyltransferase [Planctomycetota bacterium]
MRITWLLEDTSHIWGGVKVALEDADWLQRQGHDVTVLSRSGPPHWLDLECTFRQVTDFRPENLPDADVLIGTFWTTVPWAASAGPRKGVPVHYCQGYEGDQRENAALRDRIEATYRLPGVQHITISGNLTKLLRERFGITAHEVVYAIDDAVHYPAAERAPGAPLRVGIVGPWQISWKGIPTGFEACRLAQAAGQDLVLVRATNTVPDPAERATPFQVEWHERVPPAQMGDYYRSLDVFVATSIGAEEGFFLPAIEAMACGVPTVLTDIPCFRSHAARTGGDDGYALFVPPNDPAAMAEAIVVAGRMPEVRAGLRRAGLALAAGYTRDGHGRALEAALQRCLAAAPRPSPVITAPPPSLTEANACLTAGDHDAALAICDALVARGRDDEALHVLRGSALHAQRRYQDAAQAFRAAIAVGDRSADAFNRLGMVLYQAGDLRGARQSFEKALKLQPDHPDARSNLSELSAA